MSRLDLVIFGATGYTGKFVVRELARIYREENVTWGIAGRSKSKLTDTLKSVSKELSINDDNLLDKVEIIEVDVNNQESIRKMCERARLVINCVGPYRFYGEQVVKQCVLSHTHHLDVSGEPEYLEKMQLEYSQQAADNKVFVIGSCGFDSIPADLGVAFTQHSFKYDLNHIDSFLSVDFKNSPLSANYATWESAVYGFASMRSLASIRKKLFTSGRLPRSNYPQPKRTNLLGFFYDRLLLKYCFPFLGSDRSVVQRTQYFNYFVLNNRPVQYMPYFTVNNFLHVNLVIMWAILFGVLANFKFGRYLLLKFYKLFSFGFVDKKETSYEQMKDCSFRMEFRGYGYRNKLDIHEQHTEKPDREIVTEIVGPEPGYITTAKTVLNSAMVVLQESDRFPISGGVITPGAIFKMNTTSLTQRLIANGIKFNVIKDDSS